MKIDRIIMQVPCNNQKCLKKCAQVRIFYFNLINAFINKQQFNND